MCSCCFTLLARGCHNNCCSSQAVLNLINLAETLDPTSCEQVASGIIKNKMEQEGIERGQSFKISTGGNPLTLTVGTKENKSSRKFFNQISFQTVMELTSVLELTKNKTKKLISSLRKNLGSSTVVENNVISMMTSLQEEIESKYKIEQGNFIWNDEIVTRHVVFIYDTSEFILSILIERGMDPLSSMICISIDGGQGFLKVIVNVFDKTNKNEIYIDSGVKRCFILAIVEDVCEDNGNLQKLFSRLNLDNVTYHLAFDLKCANSIFGLSSHSSKYACLWCEGECSLESGTPRTLGSFDYWYNLFVENGAKRLEMKDFKNVISPRLVYLDKNAEDEVNHLVPPPELHLLMGIVTLLGRLLLDHWPLFKNWLKEHYILLRGYHGIGFDGNNSNKLLEKVDILERDVLASQTNLLPIVHCLRKFEKVKECTFGYELGSNAFSVIEEF
ncbi:uncharacterized protein LOC136077891 [Hydra vulgaris]|uniref:Uncharacterized protein LOC136077891 n=1 Tax=Hydra vulgaris TaxID=6087 RepID=A0ABM4BGR7_HYDVU